MNTPSHGNMPLYSNLVDVPLNACRPDFVYRRICRVLDTVYLIRRLLMNMYTARPANAAQAYPIYSMPVWSSVELPDADVPFVRFPVSPTLGVLLGVCCPFVSVTFPLLSALAKRNR